MADERCPTCGQKVGPWKATRICGVCQKPIRKGHKWHIEGSMIRHRVCDDPDSYGNFDPLERKAL